MSAHSRYLLNKLLVYVEWMDTHAAPRLGKTQGDWRELEHVIEEMKAIINRLTGASSEVEAEEEPVDEPWEGRSVADVEAMEAVTSACDTSTPVLQSPCSIVQQEPPESPCLSESPVHVLQPAPSEESEPLQESPSSPPETSDCQTD